MSNIIHFDYTLIFLQRGLKDKYYKFCSPKKASLSIFITSDFPLLNAFFHYLSERKIKLKEEKKDRNVKKEYVSAVYLTPC